MTQDDNSLISRTSTVLDVVKDQYQALSSQIEILTTMTAKASSKRKRSISFEEESTASSTLTAKAIESTSKASGDYQRCITKHYLSAPPKDKSNSEHLHYCELDLTCCFLHRSRYYSYS